MQRVLAASTGRRLHHCRRGGHAKTDWGSSGKQRPTAIPPKTYPSNKQDAYSCSPPGQVGETNLSQSPSSTRSPAVTRDDHTRLAVCFKSLSNQLVHRLMHIMHGYVVADGRRPRGGPSQSYQRVISCLQTGQAALRANQRSMHPRWYRCMQGNIRSSSPGLNCSRQTEHWLCSEPPDRSAAETSWSSVVVLASITEGATPLGTGSNKSKNAAGSLMC